MESIYLCKLRAEYSGYGIKNGNSRKPKKDLPPNKFGKILGATPIIMTIIATMLVGMAAIAFAAYIYLYV